jgi:uncharacterized spore protein YtfJ
MANVPISVKTLKGEPITVGEKEIVPLARVISVSIGRWGGFVRIKPVAVLETTLQGVRRIPIPDATMRVLAAIFLAGLMLPLMLVKLAAILLKPRRS